MKKGILLSLMGGALLSLVALKQYKPLGKKPIGLTSPRLKKGRFQNELSIDMSFSAKQVGSLIRDATIGRTVRKPEERLPVRPIDFSESWGSSFTRVYWMGHSALFVDLDGKKMLVDPMFGPNPSPLPFPKNARFSEVLPFEMDDLPTIDVVLLTHDHYDHLDYMTVLSIRDRVERWVVPLGVGSHLRRWGVDADKITECDWWQELTIGHWTVVCTPARHFSGRAFSDRDTTLWCSWVVIGETDRLFFSGDSGYGPHFKQIGERYGPFDFAALECGQYDQRWAGVHMLPAETVQAFQDLNADYMMPIHWGAFTLSFHDWYDPAEQVMTLAPNDERVLTPMIGECVVLDGRNDTKPWWRSHR